MFFSNGTERSHTQYSPALIVLASIILLKSGGDSGAIRWNSFPSVFVNITSKSKSELGRIIPISDEFVITTATKFVDPISTTLFVIVTDNLTSWTALPQLVAPGGACGGSPCHIRTPPSLVTLVAADVVLD
jgi:hypothetical protein